MLIAFLAAGKSFLPELEAYDRFFGKRGVRCCVVRAGESIPADADVHWHMMGTHFRKSGVATTIHEFPSASTPPLAGVKDFLKRAWTVKPDYRIFLNGYVKGCLGFHDNVPYGFRDMGVDAPEPVSRAANDFRYDFVYIGDLHPSRKPGRLFACFAGGHLRDRSLLVLSRDYGSWAERLASYTNIHFKGPVPQGDVRHFLQQSRFAINYLPDREPYNRQTSTKLLEYAACRVPVITTSYAWVRDFKKAYGGDFFFTDEGLSNVSWESLLQFPFAFPDLSAWSWEKQIEGSGIVQFLKC